MAKTTKDYFYSQHAHYLSVLTALQCAVHRNSEKVNVDFSSKENLAIKSRLSHSATITKQINAVKEGIALTSRGRSRPVVCLKVY